MADIQTYLEQILSAVYGREVRGSIHDAIEEINNVTENCVDTVEAYQDPATATFLEAMNGWKADQEEDFESWFATLTQDLTLTGAIINKRLSQVGNGENYTFDLSSIATAIAMNQLGYVFLQGSFASFESSYADNTLTITTGDDVGRVARGIVKIYVNGFLMPIDSYTMTTSGTNILISFTNNAGYTSSDVIDLEVLGFCNGIV